MAQGNLILGTMKGKLGDVVAYNYNGKQAARVRRRQVSNPKTSKQAIQRTIASTVAKFVSAFAPVLNNSLQNESGKVSTLAKIRSLNMNMLRQLAAQNQGNYAPKGSQFVAPNAYFVSRGSLNGIPVRSLQNACLYIDGGTFDSSTAKASEVFPSIAVGDQITIMTSYMDDLAEGSKVAYCRFAFKDDTTPALVQFQLGDTTRHKLNSAAIDLVKAEGPWDKLVFDAGIYVGQLIGEDYNHPVDMAGIIVSREAGKLRSNASMLIDSNYEAEYSLSDVYPTYMDGGTPIYMPSELYLNNDANDQG